jgi:hypothetical protein
MHEAQMHVENELVRQLVDQLAKLSRPAIPVEIDLWDLAMVAAYLKRSEAVVRERIACLADFPKAIRPPSTKSSRGHPLYEAREVIAWARKYKDKN